MPVVRSAMIRRTNMFFDDRPAFRKQLYHELELFFSFHHNRGTQGICRLNVSSDIAFYKLFPELFDIPHSYYYDYTKVQSRMFDKLPPNYELTFSVSEGVTDKEVRKILDARNNVSVVLDVPYNPKQGILGKIPKTLTFDGAKYKTKDADVHDIRTHAFDSYSSVCCLRFKGSKARKEEAIKSGFVRQIQ